MTKKPRVTRPKQELQNELRAQLILLQNACRSFDTGLEAIGRHLALSLRVLLHHQGTSRSLLEQLDLRTGHFVDTAGPLDPHNLLPECNLVMLRFGDTEPRYLPMVAWGESSIPPKMVPFSEWWNDPVLKDIKGRLFSRRELVCHVADTDGGAHVDPDLDEAYMDLSRNNSLGWTFQSDDIIEPFRGRPELACMRQIAHETMLTLQLKSASLMHPGHNV